MYIAIYEKSCMGTSLIITISSFYLVWKTKNLWVIFITLSGFISFLTRLFRVKKRDYIMDHPLVKADIGFAVVAMGTYIYKPFDNDIYYNIMIAFGLMIIAALMSWPQIWIVESFPLQFLGHIIIAYNLCLCIIK